MTHNVEPAAQPQMTTGKLIDRLYEIREDKKSLNKVLKDLDEEFERLKSELMLRLDTEDTTIGRGREASCSITTTVVPAAQDWDQAHEWMRENDALYLLQRRFNSAAYRELLNQGIEIPGVEPMPIRDISIRKLSKR